MTALAPLDLSGRADRARVALRELDCDGLVVTNLANVRWLTGFSGSNAVAVLTLDDLSLVTDGRYGDQARGEMHDASVDGSVFVGLTAADQVELIGERGRGLRRVALEASSVTWAAQRTYAATTFADSELVPSDRLLERLRAIKDDGEVDRLQRAAAIADDALADVVKMLSDEPSERDVALELELGMRRRGAQGASFETIVASGPASAYPHHRPNGRRIVEGDLVVIDFGALVDGYHSDMTRTFVVGDPSAEQRALIKLVTEAQAAGVRAVRAGVPAQDIDRACRNVIEAGGHGDAFTHGTGHGIGLVIHEEPFLARVPTVDLAVGNVITVEPGVYREGLGGVRVEDSLLVTSDGSRTLTSFPKDPQCPPLQRTT